MTATNGLPKLETRIRLYSGPNNGGKADLLGFAELTIGGAFVIKDIRILLSKEKGKGGVFVSFPSKRGSGGHESEYFDIAHPITVEAYDKARKSIVEAYDKARASAVTA